MAIHARWLWAPALLVALGAPEGATAGSKCTALAHKAVGKAALGRAICSSKAIKKGAAVNPTCLDAVQAKMAAQLEKAAKKGDCFLLPNIAGVEEALEAFSTAVIGALGASLPALTACCGTTDPDATDTPFCADIPADGFCFGVPDALPIQGTVCDGATGLCAATRTGTSVCCAFEGICAEGPAFDPGAPGPLLTCDPPATFVPGGICSATGVCSSG